MEQKDVSNTKHYTVLKPVRLTHSSPCVSAVYSFLLDEHITIYVSI